MFTRLVLAAALLSLLSALPLRADVRALLIGVSDYAEGTGISDLRGPKNDVMLMRSVLENRGASDIVIVADGVEGAPEPTLAAIEAGFAEITARASAGDLVYIHMSGHGTRQHDLEGDETDGLDEVFLPADVTGAGQGGKVIPNALTDDRIGALVLAIRRKGADVWLVMDSCHSGSGMRNLTTITADRHVDPMTLGIDPREARSGPVSLDTTPPETGDGLGAYLAFYATRSNDVAREGNLSKGQGEDAWYGLFSSAIAARLDAGQALSYRQLFQAVLSDMNRGGGFGAAAIQTPLWEGDLIDAPVFGGKAALGVTRYLTAGDEVQAGLIHGLREGTLLALVQDITDAPDAVLGYAQVEEAEARRAYIRPVDTGCVPRGNSLCDYSGSLPAEARFAQVELQPTDQAIRFSPPVDGTTGAALPEDHWVSALLREALTRAVARSGIQAEIGGDAYQILGTARGDSLWFGPVTAIGGEPAGLEVKLTRTMTADELVGPVLRILRAEQLAKTLELLNVDASFANPAPVEIDAGRFASDLAQLARPGQRISPKRECRPVFQAAMAGAFSPLSPSDDVKQCDILRFSAKGSQDGQIDVNRIYIDAQYCVHVEYELVEGGTAARKLGDELVMCSDCPGEVPYSAGHERLYFLISEQEQNTEALNLENLIENCVGGNAIEGTRSARSSAVRDMLGQVAQAGRTRGNMGLSMAGAASGVWVESYRWRVLPRSEAFKQNGLSE